MAKPLDLSVYGPGHISNILQVDASVYAKAYVTDGGKDTQVVRGDGTLASISSLYVGNAATATNAPWSGITGKPTTFTPSAHTHTASEISGLPTKLSAFTNDVGFITGITKSMVEGVLTGDITSHTHSYLPLSGGTLTSANPPLYINRINGFSSILYQVDGATVGILGFDQNGDLITRPKYQSNADYYNIIHAGNYNSYAPTLTGKGASGTWGINISGNAATTTKLSTARKIWGKPFDGTGDIGAGRGAGLMSSRGIYYGLSILPTGDPYYGVRTFLTYDEGHTMGAYEIAARISYGLTVSRGGGVAYDFSNIPTNLNYTSLVEIRPNGNILIGTTTDNGYKLQVNGSERVYGNLIVDGEVSALVA